MKQSSWSKRGQLEGRMLNILHDLKVDEEIIRKEDWYKEVLHDLDDEEINRKEKWCKEVLHNLMSDEEHNSREKCSEEIFHG